MDHHKGHTALRLPREIVQSLSLQVYKTHQDKTWSNLVWSHKLTLLRAIVWTRNPHRPPQYKCMRPWLPEAPWNVTPADSNSNENGTCRYSSKSHLKLTIIFRFLNIVSVEPLPVSNFQRTKVAEQILSRSGCFTNISFGEFEFLQPHFHLVFQHESPIPFKSQRKAFI